MAFSTLLILTSMVRFCGAQLSPCRPVCSGSSCVVVHRSAVDFLTAEERCRENNGELMTVRSPADERLLDRVTSGLDGGEFWIGPLLPENVCGDASDATATAWREGDKVCPPLCVTVSSGQESVKQVCSTQSDGFLCRTSYEDACTARQVAESKVFKSKKGCTGAPCQQKCNVVKDGYTCSCEKGFAPEIKDPRLCKVHCSEAKCPAICDVNTGYDCRCADGYIRDEKICEDIDECKMDQCDQLCENSFGSFRCSCKDGFVLEGKVKCVPAADDEKKKVEAKDEPSLFMWSFIWSWLLLAAVVFLVIAVGRCVIVRCNKRREIDLRHVSTAASGDVAR